MSNSSIDPSLRQQSEPEHPKRPSPKTDRIALDTPGYPTVSTAQNGPYPHRPTSAGMSDLAQQLAHAVESHPAGVEYAHHTPMGPPSAQYAHYGQDVLGGGMQTSPGGEGSDKKKLKTTRACDECRRKKIKCDSEETEKTGDKCNNCMRTNAECLYTKPAQKRGPSRGYIRELSDRVASLEERGIGVSPMTPQQGSPFFTPDTAELRGYKRTHSMSEQASAATPTGAPFARMAAPANDQIRVQFDLPTATVTKPLTDLERSQLNGWMAIGQTRFPLLPNTIEEAEHMLNDCPEALRKAFVRTVQATLGRSDSSDRTPYRQAVTLAVGLMHQPKAASALANVVHLQVCVLLLYISNTAGPSSQQYDNADPDSSVFWAKAFAIAEHLKLHVTDAPEPTEALEQLARNQGRRAYGFLQLMYLWTEIADGGLPAAPRHAFRLRPADGLTIPFDAFMLMCMLPDLELLSSHARRDEALPPPAAKLDEYLDGVKLGLAMAGGRDPADEQLVSLVHSCVRIYRFMVHSKGFSARLTPEIVREAANVVARFRAGDATFFPIAHQTLGLALIVLLEAAGDALTRVEARKALSDAATAMANGTLREDGYRTVLAKAVAERLDATAEPPKGKKNAEERTVDFTLWLSAGYMVYFGA